MEEEKRRKVLIELARKAIEKTFANNRLTITPLSEIIDIEKEKELAEALREKKGVFITLKKSGQVRGCIGTISKDEIWIQVQKYAVFSAFNDPRFPPLEKEELKNIKIEISILDDPQDIKSIEEIELGKDGVIMEVGGKGGVLLPEVAVEHGVKTPQEFLEMLCRKIGIPNDSWKKAKIKKFRTEKITN